jgi:hypothetical protein
LKTSLFHWLKFKSIQIQFLRKYLGARVIWAFRKIFNGNLTVMTLKGKKLHPDDIQEIRDFAMAYKGLTLFAMAYKEFALLSL